MKFSNILREMHNTIQLKPPYYYPNFLYIIYLSVKDKLVMDAERRTVS